MKFVITNRFSYYLNKTIIEHSLSKFITFEFSIGSVYNTKIVLDMNRMKYLVLFVFIIICHPYLNAQNEDVYFEPGSEMEKPAMLQEDKIDFGLQTGVSYMKFSKKGNAFSKYVAPNLSQQLNDKVRLTFGSVVSNTNIHNPFYTSENAAIKDLQVNSASLFARADYQLSPRLIVGGTAYYKHSLMKPIGDNNPFQDHFDSKGMQLDLNYRISNKSFINVSVNVSEGNEFYPGIQHDPFSTNSLLMQPNSRSPLLFPNY